MKFQLIILYLALILSVIAAPAQKSFLKSRDFFPTPPSQDPFYTPPEGYESQPVGTILKYRKLEGPLGYVIIPTKIKAAYQFIVRSEDTFGNPLAVATALYIPYNADPKKLLSYHVVMDAASVDCAPSYVFQLGADPISIIPVQFEQILVQAGMEEGWYVVVPDYEGPKAAFGVGELAGKAVLNSVRAVLKSGNITGIDLDAEVTYWGYSGGSLATGWAALLEPTYAPDLSGQTIGYAYGGIVADVANTAEKNVGNLFAGLIFAAMNGLSHEYPTIDKYIAENVYEDKKDKSYAVNHQCQVLYLPLFIFAGWEDYFKDDANTLYDPIVKAVTDAQSMITSPHIPSAPLYFYNSVLDEVIPSEDADSIYYRYCAAGLDIEYNQDLIGEHLFAFTAGLGGAFLWLKDRFNHVPVKKGCSKSFKLIHTITPESLAGLSDVVISAILSILQKPVGPSGFGLVLDAE